jgi:hypothetical protein
MRLSTFCGLHRDTEQDQFKNKIKTENKFCWNEGGDWGVKCLPCCLLGHAAGHMATQKPGHKETWTFWHLRHLNTRTSQHKDTSKRTTQHKETLTYDTSIQGNLITKTPKHRATSTQRHLNTRTPQHKDISTPRDFNPRTLRKHKHNM